MDPTTSVQTQGTAPSGAPARAFGEIVLETRNLETYYGPIQAIRGVSVKLHRGQIGVILGANGAGKTTVLRTISGVMDPQRGSVVYEGREIQRTDPDRIVAMGLCHVPEGREVFPLLSVRENLMMGAYLRSDRAGIAADIDKVLAYFPRLKERFEQRAGSLSGGEQQMVAISRAIMSKPKVLLMDEPSLGLSPILTKEIFQIIRRINAEEGVSILLVEQNAKIALDTGHYGFVMEVGRIVMEGDTEDLKNKEDIQEFYLGHAHVHTEGEVEGGRRRRWKKKKLWR